MDMIIGFIAGILATILTLLAIGAIVRFDYASLLDKLMCKHDWKLHETRAHQDDFGGSYTKQTLICRKCGKVKQIKL
jgi:hypothetical protein